MSKCFREVLLVASLLSAIVSAPALADEGNSSSEGTKPLPVRQEPSKWTPFKLSLWGANVAIPKRGPVYGFNLGLLGAVSAKVYGVQVAPIGSAAEEVIGFQAGLYAASTHMTGIQIAGFTNLDYLIKGGEKRKMRGLQVHGFGWSDSLSGGQFGGINIAGEGKWAQIGVLNSATVFDGIQLGGFNWDHSYRGIQVGMMNWVTSFNADIPRSVGMTGVQLGVMNKCAGDLRGVQVGLGNFNIDFDFLSKQLGRPVKGSGVQLGGSNVADEFKGVQIGFLNKCRLLKGVQIGIVNITWNENVKRILPVLNASF